MELIFNNKIVFLSSPYSSTEQEVKDERFRRCCVACGIVMKEGGYPLSPIVHGVPIASEMTLPDDFEYWKGYCLALISKSDFVLVLGIDGWDKSSGVKAEVAVAHELGKPVYLVKLLGPIKNSSRFGIIKEIKDPL